MEHEEVGLNGNWNIPKNVLTLGSHVPCAYPDMGGTQCKKKNTL